MKVFKSASALALLLLLASMLNARAAGMPGGDQFGFGAWLDTREAPANESSTSASNLAIAIAAQSQMKWIALTLDWAAAAPSPDSAPDLSALAALVGAAQQQKMEILLSIQNPPAWALTSKGPDPAYVQTLLSQVSLVTANRVLVIELFPGANLSAAWGAPANPADYLTVLQAARTALRARQQVSLVIPSLTPLSSAASPGDLSAESFLENLYQLAPNENFQIVGLHFHAIVGNPADSGLAEEGAFLRQYETVRQVMLDHSRSSDQIWITAFAWPASLTGEADQAVWLENAYRQLKGQVYIKAALFDALYRGINPADNASLLQANLKGHAALERIRALIMQQTPTINGAGASSPDSQGERSALAKILDFLRALFGGG